MTEQEKTRNEREREGKGEGAYMLVEMKAWEGKETGWDVREGKTTWSGI